MPKYLLGNPGEDTPSDLCIELQHTDVHIKHVRTHTQCHYNNQTESTVVEIRTKYVLVKYIHICVPMCLL